MIKKALVTGGAGFVGHHLVQKLLELNCEVVILDDLSTGNIENASSKSTFIEGDIRDQESLSKAAMGCDTIFHLAARVELQKSIVDPVDCFSVNVTGTANVVMEALKERKRRLILASSCAVYPLHPEDALSEDMSTLGATPYAISKVVGEQILSFYQENSNLNACSLRCFNIYGPGQRADSQYAAVIPKYIESAKQGIPLKLNGGGLQTRDFIHVDDVVDAYILMSNNDVRGVFNLGTGVETSIKSLAEIVVGIEKKTDTIIAPSNSGDASSSFADISKIQAISNFKPKVLINDGIYALYNQQNTFGMTS